MQTIILRAKLRRLLPLILSMILLLLGLAVAIFLIGQTQIFKKQAAGVCPVEGAICQWDYAQELIGSITFNYKIVDLTTGETIKSGTTQARQVTFTPVADHQYSCKVTPQTVCGLGAEKIALGTCRAQPSPTATPTLPLTPTPSVTGGPTPTVTETPGPSPTFTPTPTVEGPTVTSTPGPSPTPSATIEPSPTSVVIPTSTPGNAGTGTPEPSPTSAGTPTPKAGINLGTGTPTPLAENLPESAAMGPTFYFLIFGVLLVVSGISLLF